MTQHRPARNAGVAAVAVVLTLALGAATVPLAVNAQSDAGPGAPQGATKKSTTKTTTKASAKPAAKPATKAIAPGEADAKAALNASTRHGEMVDVPQPGGGPPIRTWVVYPERAEKAGVVLVIHEIYGLSDWIRATTDALAREGFIGVAPDLVSGMGPGGGGTDSAATRDDVVKMVRALTPEETASRLAAVRDWALKVPAANGKWATMGFCWGGARSFEQAAATPAPQLSLVFYGSSPDSLTLPKVTAPVVGFYGADDARVNSTIPRAKEALPAGKYEAHVYEGAGHGFLRGQAERDGKNLAAAQKAWPEAMSNLKRRLE